MYFNLVPSAQCLAFDVAQDEGYRYCARASTTEQKHKPVVVASDPGPIESTTIPGALETSGVSLPPCSTELSIHPLRLFSSALPISISLIALHLRARQPIHSFIALLFRARQPIRSFIALLLRARQPIHSFLNYFAVPFHPHPQLVQLSPAVFIVIFKALICRPSNSSLSRQRFSLSSFSLSASDYTFFFIVNAARKSTDLYGYRPS